MNKPNILFICTDQQTADSIIDPELLGQLPNIAFLRDNGVTFTKAVCCTPQCTASRGGILTGLYPHRTGVVTNIGAGCGNTDFPEGIDLHPRYKNAGEYFRDAGYETAYFGKWHLGESAWAQGFDRYFCDEGLAATEGVFEEYHPGKGTVDPVTTRLCCEYIKEKHEKPFILFSELINPHDCYSVPGNHPFGDELYPDVELEPHDDLDLRKNNGSHPLKTPFMEEDQGAQYNERPDIDWKRYRAFYRYMLRRVDTQVGEMLDALREKDLLKDTMVIFTSDHGDLETAHRMIFKGPFMYRELVDIPLVVAFPDQGVQPRTSDALINNIDLLPTIAGYAGLNIELQMDGKSFKEVIDGEKNEHRQYVVSEYYCKQRWCNPCRMLATAQFKYVRYRDGYEELYDHFNDQLENHNLADRSDFQHIKGELSQKLDQWMRETGDTFEQMPVSDRAGRIISV